MNQGKPLDIVGRGGRSRLNQENITVSKRIDFWEIRLKQN